MESMKELFDLCERNGGKMTDQEIVEAMMKGRNMEMPSRRREARMDNISQWTNKYPTQPGFYWLRNYQVKSFHMQIPGPVLVIVRRNLTFDTIVNQDIYHHSKWDLVSAEWYGPIQPPE